MPSESSSPKRNRSSPSLRKIVLFLVLLLLPIMLAGPAFLAYSMTHTQKTEEEQITGAVQFQLDQMDRTLSTVNMFLMDTLLNNSLCQTISREQDIHRRNSAVRDLQTEILMRSSLWSQDFNFLYYAHSTDTSVTVYNSASDYSDCQEITRQLKETIQSRQSQNTNIMKWTAVAVHGRVYFQHLYMLRDQGVACWVPADSLFLLLRESVLSQNGFYAVLDTDGQPLVPDERTESWLKPRKKYFSLMPSFSARFTTARVDMQLLVVDEEYLSLWSSMVLLVFFAVILVTVLAFTLYTLYYFRRYIQQPFEQFREHISEFAISRENVRQHGFSELNEAVGAFDSLKEQLEGLKIDVYEERLALARTELEYFQLQIKPHFFVNCFSILFGMAQKQDYARIQEFCLKLSAYVRYLFRGSLSSVPLGEELAMIREYLDIQDIRHRTETTMKNQVDPELMSFGIPPLLLLSFVENSVKHSLGADTPLQVKISVEKELRNGAPVLVLSVQDNGPGYSPQALEALNSMDSTPDMEPTEKGEHIGIRNIRKRLFLLYGPRYSLTFSNPGGYAKAEIVLPMPDAAPDTK